MATKQQKLLEDTTAKVSEATSLIGEVADNAKSAVSELEKIASGNSDVLDSNKSVLKKLNFGVILGSLSVLIALGVSAFLFFNSRMQFEKSNQMLMEAIALFAENVGEMTKAQKNVNAYFDLQKDIQNELTFAREALEFIPKDIGKTLQSIGPQIETQVNLSLENSEERVGKISDAAIADLSQKFVVISDDVRSMSEALSSAMMMASLQSKPDAEQKVEGDVANEAAVEKDTEAYEYGLQQVRSDFEQVILLQKELSAKISLLQKDAVAKVSAPKKVSTKKKTPKPAPKNPFQYP